MAYELWCKQRLYAFLSSFTSYYVSCDLQKRDVAGSTSFVVPGTMLILTNFLLPGSRE